ncbi:sensor histidine kinase [Leifsonia poae]|uniref:sensor histidine kinase n=1 Tax=Leifsonia poae TaxID=110933 RepID=UPI003D67F82E
MVDPRWRTVLTVTPYLVLGLLAAFALGVGWGAWERVIPELILCAGYALLVMLFRDLQPPWTTRPSAIAVFLTGIIVINFALVMLDSWFAFLTIATFSIAYSIAEWPWELLPVGATAVVAGLAQASSLGLDVVGAAGRVLVVALNVIIMCGLSWALRLMRVQQARAATEAERARLAREIHDTLAQGFAGIVTQLQAAEQAQDEAARDRHTGAALSLAREGLGEARRSVQALRPAALETAALPEAIAEAARRWSSRTGIPVDVRTIDAARALPTDAEVALLRTAQEALANVERHADAHHVTLTLRHDGRATRLDVCDDGRGFDPSSPGADSVSGGYGLIAMRERLAALAGDLIIESSPGKGTAVRAEVPG